MVAVDDVFSLLNSPRRRFALYYLEQADEPVAIEELAEAVAEMETEPETNTEPTGIETDVAISLHHNHLEKADSYEFIEYDRQSGEIRLLDSPPTFDLILTVAQVLEQPE
ncbi:hypothetical protein ACLI4U_15135 [Natrialbaceae archaeon A-CW2]|uniref:DUF7344 domain-containing protein n=1 Tax=Natronosalvus amylolyticus TaxID=2961994 RepID=UPI0020C94F9D|nr:hypothetical protein [Natronosalvus amylolyticus]